MQIINLNSRTIFILLYLLVLTLLSGCVNKKRNIYNSIPLGTKLSIRILPLCDQIFSNNKKIVLVCDLNKDENYDPSLLFFNTKNELIGACYFASQKIEYSKDDSIFAIENVDRVERINWFVNDMPKPYKLCYTKSKYSSYMTISNKVIDSLDVDTNLDVQLFIRQSTDQFAEISWTQDSSIESIVGFSREMRINYPLNKLTFDYYNNRIMTTSEKDGRYLQDEMIVYNRAILDRFYCKLIQRLSSLTP